MSKVKFGIMEMQEFAEQSDDDRIKRMFSKICEYRRRMAIWTEWLAKNQRAISDNPKMLLLLSEVAMSPVDLENDGECCMRIPTRVLQEIRGMVISEEDSVIVTESGQIVLPTKAPEGK